jgi:hypothetical protein
MFAEPEQPTVAVALWRTTAHARADVGEVDAVSVILDRCQESVRALTASSLASPTTACLQVKPVLSRPGDGLYGASSGHNSRLRGGVTRTQYQFQCCQLRPTATAWFAKAVA